MDKLKKAIAAAVGLVLVSCGGSGTDPEPTSVTSSALTAQAHSVDPSTSRGALLPRLAAVKAAVASTVPPNGDVNPYGVAFVPPRFPPSVLRPGDVIVSNFNNGSNLQGTGTTIVRVNPGASPTVFFADASVPGLSTALGVLSAGLVLVGNLPSSDGSGSCNGGDGGQELDVGQGAITVIDSSGHRIQSLADAALLDGPWDLALDDDGARATVFVSNALSGTVTRLNLGVAPEGVTVESATTIASGYLHRCDPSAFVVAPTGLALDEERDVLYVASTGDNAIYAVEHAETRTHDDGQGRLVVHDDTHLHGPLGLVRTSRGDLIAAQGDAVNPDPAQPSEIVEFSPAGAFVAEFSIDTAPGSAFGLALARTGRDLRFAAVDDGTNQLDEWIVPAR